MRKHLIHKVNNLLHEFDGIKTEAFIEYSIIVRFSFCDESFAIQYATTPREINSAGLDYVMSRIEERYYSLSSEDMSEGLNKKLRDWLIQAREARRAQ